MQNYWLNFKLNKTKVMQILCRVSSYFLRTIKYMFNNFQDEIDRDVLNQPSHGRYHGGYPNRSRRGSRYHHASNFTIPEEDEERAETPLQNVYL